MIVVGEGLLEKIEIEEYQATDAGTGPGRRCEFECGCESGVRA